jgi:hypothetical protein
LSDFIRLDDSIKDAVLTIMNYVRVQSGIEPTQEELAVILKSYFILNEVGNQIRYQLKKDERKESEKQENCKGPLWTLNLKGEPRLNILARAGIFHRGIQEAIEATRQHMKKISGSEPNNNAIAASLKSSFILSEIKNQMDYLRKTATQKKRTPLKFPPKD